MVEGGHIVESGIGDGIIDRGNRLREVLGSAGSEPELQGC